MVWFNDNLGVWILLLPCVILLVVLYRGSRPVPKGKVEEGESDVYGGDIRLTDFVHPYPEVGEMDIPHEALMCEDAGIDDPAEEIDRSLS